MAAKKNYTIELLSSENLSKMGDLLTIFGEAFDEADTYCGKRPDSNYMSRLLDSNHFVGLVALENDKVTGGLAAYILPKFEQQRNEMYLYDIAVDAAHRRKGIATALIEELKNIAKSRGVYVIFVQADHGDAPAIELYSKLGKREDVHHFDISPD